MELAGKSPGKSRKSRRRARSRTRLGNFWRGFGRNRAGLAGAAGLILLCVLSLAGPWLTPYEYNEPNLEVGVAAGGSSAQPPGTAHPMGTGVLGRDQLTDVLYAGRVSLSLALTVTVISTAIGCAVGFAAGYRGRLSDAGLMGLTDLTFALPLVPVVLVVGATFGFSLTAVTIALALLLWPRMARLVRAEVLSARSREYVEAARALGVSGPRMALRHLLPNISGVVVTEATFILAAAILTESALSYLGVLICDLTGGCQSQAITPPTLQSDVSSWGQMLGEARDSMTSWWWLTLFPGVMISLTALFALLLGDGLRDALDPKT